MKTDRLLRKATKDFERLRALRPQSIEDLLQYISELEDRVASLEQARLETLRGYPGYGG